MVEHQAGFRQVRVSNLRTDGNFKRKNCNFVSTYQFDLKQIFRMKCGSASEQLQKGG